MTAFGSTQDHVQPGTKHQISATSWQTSKKAALGASLKPAAIQHRQCPLQAKERFGAGGVIGAVHFLELVLLVGIEPQILDVAGLGDGLLAARADAPKPLTGTSRTWRR